MALVDHKSGAAAVDPDDHNAVVDAVIALQGSGSGAVYKQSSDPGAVGAGALWLDTAFAPTQMKTRNAGDTGWDDAGTSGGRIEFHYTSIAFDTPNLYTTGVPVYTPDSVLGEVVLPFGWLDIHTPFNGADDAVPLLHLVAQGDTPGGGDDLAFASIDASAANVTVGSNSVSFYSAPFPTLTYQAVTPGIPYVVVIDDGSGGDPGSTAGAIQVVLVTFDPTA